MAGLAAERRSRVRLCVEHARRARNDDDAAGRKSDIVSLRGECDGLCVCDRCWEAGRKVREVLRWHAEDPAHRSLYACVVHVPIHSLTSDVADVIARADIS